LADSSGPFVTDRSSSEHGPDTSVVSAGAGLGDGLTVTVTVEGDDGAGAWGVDAAGLANELSAVVGDWTEGACSAEHPAIRATATKGSMSFIYNSYEHGK